MSSLSERLAALNRDDRRTAADPASEHPGRTTHRPRSGGADVRPTHDRPRSAAAGSADAAAETRRPAHAGSASRRTVAQHGPAGPSRSGHPAGRQRGGAVRARRPQPRAEAAKDRFEDLKESVHTELLQQLGPQLYDANLEAAELEAKVRTVLADVLAASNRPLTRGDRDRITQEIADDILGYGPLEPYLRDADVAEVMVNGPFDIWLERKGKLSRSTASSRTRHTCAARSTRSSPASAAAWTSPPPWSTPGSPTAAVSTPSSRRWRSTAAR